MKQLLFFMFITGCATPFTQDSTLFTKYEDLMIKNPGMSKIFECKPLDIKSSKKAMKYRTEIEAQLPLLIKPNFNGVYRLVDVSLSTGTEWLLADCRSGKFTGATLTGDLMFSWDSAVVIKNPPGVSETLESYKSQKKNPPEIYLVDERGQLALIENKIQPPHP